jgi:hypothetical protein
MSNNLRFFIRGAIFGLFAPIAGLFTGLQLSSIFGNILLFPVILLSKLINQPFGDFSIGLKLSSIILSILFWGISFVIFGKILNKVLSRK